MRIGMSLVSGVIFLALTIAATVIVYQAGVPIVKRMQAAAIIDQMKAVFSDLDSVIRQVASEGPGSKRTVYLDIQTGEFVVNGSENAIYWKFETDVPIMSPRTAQQFGNIRVGNNLETKAWSCDYHGVDAWCMENKHLLVYVKRFGSQTSPQTYSTPELLLAIYQKDLDKWLNNTGFLDISLDDNPQSKTGDGWTELEQEGNHLPYAKVIAHMNSPYASYKIIFTLESGTDFLEVSAEI